MLSLLPCRWVELTPDYHSPDPIASLTSKSICCSLHQRCGTAPLFRLPCLHSIKIRRVTTYTAIVCRRIVMYSSTPACSSHTLPTRPSTSGISTYFPGPSAAYASLPSGMLHGCGTPLSPPKWASRGPTFSCHRVARPEPPLYRTSPQPEEGHSPPGALAGHGPRCLWLSAAARGSPGCCHHPAPAVMASP
jgi:hypothetical protein